MKIKMLFVGGYKEKPKFQNNAGCLMSGYSHGTANYGFMYVLEVTDEKENIYRYESGGVVTNMARCLKARYTAGITNHKGSSSGVLIYESKDKNEHKERI